MSVIRWGAGGSRGVRVEFEVRLDYLARPCLKTNKKLVSLSEWLYSPVLGLNGA